MVNMSPLSEHDKAILNCIFNPNLPLNEVILPPCEDLKDEEESTEALEKSKVLELEAVKLAERGELERGLDLMNNAITIAPRRPSLYNNRAHILQYLRKFEDAFKDVNTAIELCTIDHKRTKCLAHCQRGVLHRRADRVELAKNDFEVAAQLGNQFAKSQLVHLNPYAALCNQMLRQVMDTLK